MSWVSFNIISCFGVLVIIKVDACGQVVNQVRRFMSWASSDPIACFGVLVIINLHLDRF